MFEPRKILQERTAAETVQNKMVDNRLFAEDEWGREWVVECV